MEEKVRWVKISETTPDEDTSYVVMDSDETEYVAWLSDDLWSSRDDGGEYFDLDPEWILCLDDKPLPLPLTAES